jgi:hypothetical protein
MRAAATKLCSACTALHPSAFSTRAHVALSHSHACNGRALSHAPGAPQLVYPLWLGRVLHSLPLLLVAAALGLPRRRGALLREAAGGAAAWAAAAAAGTALPAAVGALRAYASGVPGGGTGAQAVDWGGCVVVLRREDSAQAVPQARDLPRPATASPLLVTCSVSHAQQTV